MKAGDREIAGLGTRLPCHRVSPLVLPEKEEEWSRAWVATDTGLPVRW